MRFVDAYYSFTPTQRDFIMLVQDKTSKQKTIKSDFTIDLKPYFEAKGLKLSDVRHGHFTNLTSDLLESKVTFKYRKGDRLYSHYNLFKRCTVNKDFSLDVSIIDDVLPLFYINKLEEGHFKDNRLIREAFEASYPEYDTYVAYLPETFIDFKESSTKKLFTKLLQYRKLKKYRYEFSKEELYLMLGYGHLVDVKDEDIQTNIFNLVMQEFVQTKYKGVEGWKTLRKKLNQWLKEISDHKDSGIKIKTIKSNYFATEGRPVRSIFIDVEYDDELVNLSDDQKKGYDILIGYGLSNNQARKIVSDFKTSEISGRIRERIVAKRDHHGNKYYGEYQRHDHRKIDNVPGYIYGIVFGYGKQ